MNIIGFGAAFAATFLSGVDSPALQTAATAPTMGFVQSFIGTCVMAFPDFARIEAAAEATKWKRITDPATLKTMGPQDGGTDYKTWSLIIEGQGAFTSIGRSTIDGRKAKFCSVVSQLPNIEQTRALIVKLLRATLVGSDQENGQNYVTYRFKNDDKPTILIFIGAIPMGMKGLTATTMIDDGAVIKRRKK